jgi:hypothetical protein
MNKQTQAILKDFMSRQESITINYQENFLSSMLECGCWLMLQYIRKLKFEQHYLSKKSRQSEKTEVEAG